MNTEGQNYQAGVYLGHTPAAAKVAGEIIEVGGRGAMCASAIAANVQGAVQVKDVIKVRAAAVSGDAGDPIGWDDDGDPVGGTAGSGAATTVLSDADFLLGSLTEDLAATDGEAKVALNEYVNEHPNFDGFTFEEVTANKTLDAQDCGKAFIVTADAKVITLPATASGLGPVAIINGGADGAVAVNISPNANDKIMGPDIAGTDNKDLINTKATAKHWDYVIIRPDVAGNGWSVDAIRGTWATEA